MTESGFEPMLVPVHIATLVLVALLLVTLAVWQLVERPAGHWLPLISFDDREFVPVPTGQRIQWDLPEEWQLRNTRRGLPTAHLRAPIKRSSCVRR